MDIVKSNKSLRRLKAVVVALLALAATIFLCASKAAETPVEFVKVGLHYGSTAKSSYTVGSASGFVLGAFDGEGFHEGMTLPGYTSIGVSLLGKQVVLMADGVLVSGDFGENGCIMPIGYKEGAFIQYEGASYRGGIGFVANSSNTVNAINCLHMEDYLYGVVGAEMGRSNPAEALKAQAVASRSFTLLKLGTHKGSGFDICATAHCQSYKAQAGEYAETTRAVDETRGQVVSSGGEAVSGYYSKNSGGYTQNSEDVWNERLEYLRGVPDEFSPVYAWTWKATFQDIRTALSNSGAGDPGDISRIEISKRDAAGHVGELRATGNRGVVTLSKEQVRTALGASYVKSLMFSFAGGVASAGSGAGDGAQTGAKVASGSNSASGGTAGEVYATNGTSSSRLQGKAYVLSGDGKTASVDVSGLSVFGRGKVGSSGNVAVGGGSIAQGGYESVGSSPVEFIGRGYGHGVGMPQDSAIEMAKQGYGYVDILKKYYTGVDIVALY